MSNTMQPFNSVIVERRRRLEKFLNIMQELHDSIQQDMADSARDWYTDPSWDKAQRSILTALLAIVHDLTSEDRT